MAEIYCNWALLLFEEAFTMADFGGKTSVWSQHQKNIRVPTEKFCQSPNQTLTQLNDASPEYLSDDSQLYCCMFK